MIKHCLNTGDVTDQNHGFPMWEATLVSTCLGAKIAVKTAVNLTTNVRKYAFKGNICFRKVWTLRIQVMSWAIRLYYAEFKSKSGSFSF